METLFNTNLELMHHHAPPGREVEDSSLLSLAFPKKSSHTNMHSFPACSSWTVVTKILSP